MALTISTYASTTDMTTLEHVKDMLELTTVSSERDALLEILIKRASKAIDGICGRAFARQTYVETFPGWGTTEVVLNQSPIAGTTTPTVTYDGDSVASVVVENREVGILYRENGWQWTAVQASGVLVENMPAASSELPKYSATYTAGYLLPGDDYSSKNTISASDVDDSFNDTASGFPLLVAGDRIVVDGFADSADNGTFTVVSRTEAKIIVDATLVTEAASSIVTVNVCNLPDDIEQACIEAVIDWYKKRKTGGAMGDVTSKKVGDLSINYAAVSSGPQALPLKSVSMLMAGDHMRNMAT